jgi:hypothetical protein
MASDSEAPHHIECHRDLSAFFYETLSKALATRGIAVPTHTESYLVRMLASLAHDPGALSQSLVELRCHAEQGPRETRLETLRTLGDHALSVSSLFEPHRERIGLSRAYVTGMGETAYRNASQLASASHRKHERQRAEVFFDLGEHFMTYAAVLEDVRESTALGGGDDVLSLFERYRKTQSPALLARLLEQGAWTCPVPDNEQNEPS